MNKMDRNEMVHQIVGIEAMLENGLFEDPTEEQKLQKEKESLERKVRLMDIQELLEEAEDDQEKAELLSEKEKLDLQEELEQLKGKTVYAYIAAPDKILLRKFTVDDLFLVRGEKMVAVGYFHFPLKLISGITTVNKVWFSFERNDKEACAILSLQECQQFAKDMEDLNNRIRDRVAEHTFKISVIERGEIVMSQEETSSKIEEKE